MHNPLSPKTRFISGAGDIGFGLPHIISSACFRFTLTDAVNRNPAIAGIAILIGRIRDNIHDLSIASIYGCTRSQ